MIAGSEIIMDEGFDDFLFKKRKKKTAKQKAERKAKRQKFWKGFKDVLKELGRSTETGLPTDQPIQVSNPFPQTPVFTAIPPGHEDNGNDTDDDKQGIPVVVWIVGGVVLFAGGVWAYQRFSKKTMV